MNRQQLKSFLRGNAVSMLGVGVLGVMNYLIRRLLSLNLSSTDFGFFYSAFAVIMLILVFLDLGLGQSTTILLSKSFADNDSRRSNIIYTISLLFRAFLAVTVFVIMELASPYLAEYYFNYSKGKWVLSIMLLLTVTQTLESVFQSVLKARKDFLTIQVLSNVKAALILVGIYMGIRFLNIGYGAFCFVIASILIVFSGFIITKSLGVKLSSIKKIPRVEINRLCSFSSWIAISTAGLSIMYYMDTVCLTWLKGLESVALYNIALPIMQIVQGFFIFPAIFTPYVAEMWHHENYIGVKRSCLTGSLIMLLTLPVFLLIGLRFGPDIISILFDKKYVGAAPAVTILWCGMVFFSIASLNINALNSGYNQRMVAVMVVSCVIVNLILNIIFIPLFGVAGAALATTATYLIMAAGSIISLMFIFKRRQT
ncbi:oligosaccharide flippase family protein [Lentisphaerota bacterium ZTH]|nr:oligosaccharide flippase family protein [Lentisphaerota bacterium]WET05747.1 oligosaccharide flippase family protein [Lentisphaerota bacterium ZTH]